MSTSSTANQATLDLTAISQRFQHQQQSYANAEPFPHCVLEDFLPEPMACEAMEAFPPVKSDGWINYVHVNERKHGLNKMELLPEAIQRVIRELNSEAFVAELSKLTGIPNLVADDKLEGGGLHQTQRGGYLNIHADFTVHPHKRKWKRRVNLLVYLNEGWEESYGGGLELWTRDMKECKQRILPLFNRCVIFNTDEDSWHGSPEPLMCPEDESRKSIALYYFTEEDKVPALRTTHYKARPGDGAKSFKIWLDTKMIAGYTRVKRFLGLNDDFASKILRFFSGKN